MEITDHFPTRLVSCPKCDTTHVSSQGRKVHNDKTVFRYICLKCHFRFEIEFPF